MKILVKMNGITEKVLSSKNYGAHCSNYHPIMFYNLFKQLGHDVDFLTQETEKNLNNYDMFFVKGIEGFCSDIEYSERILQEFKGIKCFYSPSATSNEMLKYFDIIFPTECPEFVTYFKTKYPEKKVVLLPYICPEFKIMDKDLKNPYNDDGFKILYTGIIWDRFLEFMNRLAEMGENIYLAGKYRMESDPKNKSFTYDKIQSKIHPNIHVIFPELVFTFGTQFNWIKYADLGLNFYRHSSGENGEIKAKLIEYLCNGLPTISENCCPNAFRIKQYKAGQLIEWNNFDKLYEAIQLEKNIQNTALNMINYKKYIRKEARKIHNPLTVVKTILKSI